MDVNEIYLTHTISYFKASKLITLNVRSSKMTLSRYCWMIALSCYKCYSWFLLVQGKVSDALFTLELGRGRALVDLISQKYRIQGTDKVNGESSNTLHNFLYSQKTNFLYIAVMEDFAAILWFVDESGNVKFKLQWSGRELLTERNVNVTKGFGVYRSLLEDQDQEVECEDRSLSALCDDDPLDVVRNKTRSQTEVESKVRKIFSYLFCTVL